MHKNYLVLFSCFLFFLYPRKSCVLTLRRDTSFRHHSGISRDHLSVETNFRHQQFSHIMGNCVETCRQGKPEEGDEMQQQDKRNKQEDGEVENEVGFVKESNLGKDDGNSKLRVKILLTKEELEWLMMELKDREGKNLEEVLEEIQKGRAKLVEVDQEGWKPSLESIMECPEVTEMER